MNQRRPGRETGALRNRATDPVRRIAPYHFAAGDVPVHDEHLGIALPELQTLGQRAQRLLQLLVFADIANGDGIQLLTAGGHMGDRRVDGKLRSIRLQCQQRTGLTHVCRGFTLVNEFAHVLAVGHAIPFRQKTVQRLAHDLGGRELKQPLGGSAEEHDVLSRIDADDGVHRPVDDGSLAVLQRTNRNLRPALAHAQQQEQHRNQADDRAGTGDGDAVTPGPDVDVRHGIVHGRADIDDQRIVRHRAPGIDPVNLVQGGPCNAGTGLGTRRRRQGRVQEYLCLPDVLADFLVVARKPRTHDPVRADQRDNAVPAQIEVLVEVREIGRIDGHANNADEAAVGLAGTARGNDRPLLVDARQYRLADEQLAIVGGLVDAHVLAIGQRDAGGRIGAQHDHAACIGDQEVAQDRRVGLQFRIERLDVEALALHLELLLHRDCNLVDVAQRTTRVLGKRARQIGVFAHHILNLGGPFAGDLGFDGQPRPRHDQQRKPDDCHRERIFTETDRPKGQSNTPIPAMWTAHPMLMVRRGQVTNSITFVSNLPTRRAFCCRVTPARRSDKVKMSGKACAPEPGKTMVG